jgi:hypothetical protein
MGKIKRTMSHFTLTHVPLLHLRWCADAAVEDLFNARVVVETDRLAARGGVELDRKRDQAKADVTLPDTVPHG